MKFYPQKFKTIRESVKLTQQDVADALGIKYQSVQGWESGKTVPRMQNIYSIVDLFHCSAREFADFEPEEYIEPPKTTRKTVGKTAAKPEPAKAPEQKTKERRIIIDLAQRIEQRGRERFAVKSANIRKRLMEAMESCWPHSGDQTLVHMAIGILTNVEPGEDEIFAEIRELNSDIVPSERPMMPCPYETNEEVGK